MCVCACVCACVCVFSYFMCNIIVSFLLFLFHVSVSFLWGFFKLIFILLFLCLYFSSYFLLSKFIQLNDSFFFYSSRSSSLSNHLAFSLIVFISQFVFAFLLPVYPTLLFFPLPFIYTVILIWSELFILKFALHLLPRNSANSCSQSKTWPFQIKSNKA